MPSGVEHIVDIYSTAGVQYVRIPLMPSGVEHIWKTAGPTDMLAVRIPLMPSGVEHAIGVLLDRECLSSENSFDAVRR